MMMMLKMATRILSARTIMVIIRLAGCGHDDPNLKNHDDPNLKNHDDQLQVLEGQAT
jgi:hypothetical protein